MFLRRFLIRKCNVMFWKNLLRFQIQDYLCIKGGGDDTKGQSPQMGKVQKDKSDEGSNVRWEKGSYKRAELVSSSGCRTQGDYPPCKKYCLD